MTLSPRQLEVLRRIANGRTPKGVALDMGLSRNTVKDHATAIRLKLGAKTTEQAMVIATRAGLV